MVPLEYFIRILNLLIAIFISEIIMFEKIKEQLSDAAFVVVLNVNYGLLFRSIV